MSDPKLVDCPKCLAPALKKQLTAARFKLKGTGWYETDFKNSGKKPVEAKPATKAAPVDGAAPATQTKAAVESTPAAATD